MKKIKNIRNKILRVEMENDKRTQKVCYENTAAQEEISLTREGKVNDWAEKLKIERLDFTNLNMDYSLISLIPEHIARKYTAVALSLTENKLRVAMKDPFDLAAVDDLRAVTQKEIEIVMASEQEILDLIEEAYTVLTTKQLKNQVEHQIKRNDTNLQKNIQEEASQTPVVQLVNHIFDSCILKGASDIHIEPMEEDIRIRYRLDGELHEFTRIQREALDRIVTRIRLLADLNITERRRPQDGRISKMVRNHMVDMRLSFLPTMHGEKAVVRIMDQSVEIPELDTIGFCKDDYKKVKNILKNSYGMMIVVGPTGSGKSTTLSSIIKSKNHENINIVTVEDPVEKLIDGVNQVSINRNIGLTFPDVLRAVLRQDPDMIVVGEIRDNETSQVAIRAALTGHLVLTTLHTNDAVGSIIRLVDMGIESFKVADAVKGVISQRLVRRLCTACKEEYLSGEYEEITYNIPRGTAIYKAKGCPLCHSIGYKGRIAVHEVLIIDSYLARMISSGKVTKEMIQEEAVRRGMRSLQVNALDLVIQGDTTIEEVMKKTYG